MADTGYLLTAPFTPGMVTPPAPYTIRVNVVGEVVVASVDATGDTA
jgi:hypothetical protein